MRRFSFILIFLTTALCVYAAQSVKTVNGLAVASVKTMDQLAIASVKNVAGLDNTGSVSTSYANTGGTGNRTAIITATSDVVFSAGDIAKLINGTSAYDAYFSTAAASAKYIRFDFGSGKVIDEARLTQSAASTHGTWKWQGSNDASSWTDIGSSFSFGGSTTFTMTSLAGNATSWRYYQLVGISGSTTSSPWLYEIEFKISS